MNLNQAAARMREYGRAVEQNAQRAQRSAASDVLTGTVLGTPVDTGLARSNWQVGIGTPKANQIRPYVPYAKFSQANGRGRSERANTVIAIEVGRTAIARSAINRPIYVSNSVSYLALLRQGRSKQQPSDWIPASVQIAVMNLRNARLLR